MKHFARPVFLVLALAACDPAQTADKIGRRAAETVVRPVVDDRLSGPAADAATNCIVSNASAADVQLLARDVGVVAGTQTEATVLRIAREPAAAACLARAGIAPLGG